MKKQSRVSAKTAALLTARSLSSIICFSVTTFFWIHSIRPRWLHRHHGGKISQATSHAPAEKLNVNEIASWHAGSKALYLLFCLELCIPVLLILLTSAVVHLLRSAYAGVGGLGF